MNAVTDRRALQLPLDRFDVSDPGLYQAQTYHAYFDRLRREDPLHWCADSRFRPLLVDHPLQGHHGRRR